MGNTILLKGRGVRLERVAAETITPGMLVNVDSTDKLIKHATEGGASMKAFAVENDLEGKEITDNYVADDYAQAEILRNGDEVYTFIEANGTAVVIGDLLESAGDGTLQKLTTGVAIAQALEAVDNSAGGTPARIKARVL